MATWQAVKSYLANNYASEPFEDGLKMTFTLHDDRSQVIVAVPSGPEGDPHFLDFHSPVAEFGAVDLERLVRRTIDFSMGAVSTKSGVVTLRATMPLENLDTNEIEDPLNILLLVADQLERELTGTDTY